jgi:hypothetical protein
MRVAACKPYRDHTPPVLRNLGVEFGAWDRATGRAGAFVFRAGVERVFHEFGKPYSTGGGAAAVNTTFVYDLPLEAKLIAPLDGLITRLEFQPESNDYELDIRTSQVWDWSVIIDHIASPVVTLGASVKAGDVLGKVSLGKSGYSTMPELQINEEITNDASTFENRMRIKTVLHCPASFVGEAVAAQVTQLMKDWEEFKGQAVYPKSPMPRPGCLFLTSDP